MTPKLEIHAAHDNFVAATYTPDRTASVTALGLSAFDAVANLRVYLQPFGYELPRIEIAQVRVGTVSPECGEYREHAAELAAAAKSVEYCQPGAISECESAVDAIFAQEGFTGHADIDFVRAILKDAGKN